MNLFHPIGLDDRLNEIGDLEPGTHLGFEARLGRLHLAEACQHGGRLCERNHHDPVAVTHDDVAGIDLEPAQHDGKPYGARAVAGG